LSEHKGLLVGERMKLFFKLVESLGVVCFCAIYTNQVLGFEKNKVAVMIMAT